MLHKNLKSMMLVLLMAMFTITSANAQELQKEYDNDEQSSDENYDRIRIDRYLNVEIWTDHDDDEYYEGDRVKFNYRVSRDAFVAIYSIDSKGRLNLLFPNHPGQENFINGGVSHSLPGRNDDYDLEVSGPEGVENVQIIASREPFPIPDWYDNSGLFCDWEDRHDYMDWVNSEYFVKYEGQRFAYDRTSLYVYEWEPDYFRPVYRPYYPNWTTCGNVYVDYWPGSSIYIDGIFWGISPCYIPRIYVGWHTFTVYDHYNYCWEYDVHVTRYNTVVLNQNVIVTQPNVRSKFKTVRLAGYQEPNKVGYVDFDDRMKVIKKSGAWKIENTGKIAVNSKEIEKTKIEYAGTRKFVQGSAKVVKTERGIETAGAGVKSGNDSGPAKRTNTEKIIEKRSSGDNGNSESRGSIFKRRDSGGSTKAGTSSELKATMKKKNNPSRNESENSSPSGSYKKISPASPKKESSNNPDNSGNKISGGKEKKDGSSKESAQPQKSGKQSDNSPKIKPSDSGKSGNSAKSGGSTKPNSDKPKKESGAGKIKSGEKR